MFWERFIELCNNKGLTPNNVCAQLGYSTAIATKWKNGSIPRSTTLKKIADYFGVSVNYLSDKEEKPTDDDELSEDTIIYHRDGRTMKKKLTKEQMDMLAAMLEAIPEVNNSDL